MDKKMTFEEANRALEETVSKLENESSKRELRCNPAPVIFSKIACKDEKVLYSSPAVKTKISAP